MIKKEKISAEQKAQALTTISARHDLEALADCDLVIEAATENEAVKLDLFRQLDALVRPDGIIASNTSSLSITQLAAATRHPQRVIGLHFFNPVPMMDLVEVVRGPTQDSRRTCGVSALHMRDADG